MIRVGSRALEHNENEIEANFDPLIILFLMLLLQK